MIVLLPGQLRRWTSRGLSSGVLVEGDLITIIKVHIDNSGEEIVTYISRHGQGETPADIVERCSEKLAS